ncbi:bifunctional 4-hydroxy-2-oxoglutarate aldolase/2-dehydro-3-deoxy-phosphogluconate aldolase [Flavihumibacter sp. CACIAM 22H1]|uniref:bifunctional 4-hydroxy-2-oxoglutarate aldolase/2-dehydro-3-deoxy-phosphogluconate aldolase n=1 Tax=Flavihumibacter sp. CACIAM 22H1 TaxID=1812911 RepID=UPI0007A7C66D|nr:bifunctional 4-hydroxy-2-oxoglutarate aldolase/2-dehydro-3-deoxy-phosphogluconate aldolase [Flavihumibacter sp. CACIAM 22H1]KYP13024.1 MAG: 2-dehydro-3-deoxyphosphogluconate aldolase [Flavihumibacter sp. CACIAM 22H1]
MCFIQQLTSFKIIAILRGLPADKVIPVAEVLQEAGIRFIEITMNSPEPLKNIERLVTKMGDQLRIGAGTVLDVKSAADAIKAGASFILSPIVDLALIEATKKMGAISIPGAFTPTEVFLAHKAGADIVKVFPAISPAYIRDLKGPLPQIPLLPTGGIVLNNSRAYLDAGAIGLGVGNALVNSRQPVTDAYLAALKTNAQQFIEAIHS